MNRKFSNYLFSLLAVFSFITFFVPRVWAEDKIALVSLQRALNEVNEGKKAKSALELDYKAKQKEIESLKADLKKMKDEIDAGQGVWKPELKKQKTDELQAKFMTLQQKASDYETALKKQEAESADKILAALKTMVVDVAKKGSYTLLFENSAEFILYSAKGVDITDELIKEYNARGGSGK